MTDTLVVVSLRGGMDALEAVTPFREDAYYRARPTIAAPPPASGGAVDLDGRFALHPALAPLAPLYERGQLAVVHAVGWPGETHSHFEVWDEIESGAAGGSRPRDGWLARVLARSAPDAAVRAVALADTMPRLLAGLPGACVMREPPVAVLPGEGARDARARSALRGLYGDGSDLGRAGVRALETVEALAGLAASGEGAREPAYPASQFGRDLLAVERLLRAGTGLEAASVELGGWDTHVAQPGAMAARLDELARGLSAFHARQRDLGHRVTVVALSEFGRRLAENASGGTDHGQGGAMFLLGTGVRGGRVYGDWPGVSSERLSGPGDLAATTDVRDVLGELVSARAGDAAAAAAFPGFRGRARLGIFE